VADYARVPLLNPDQKVKDWREKLPALENEYDSRMIPLGKMDSGVYLIEGVNGGMRAYSIAIVTNLTMIEKDEPSRPGHGLHRRPQDRRATRRRSQSKSQTRKIPSRPVRLTNPASSKRT
jgi:hypothetical protein